jgi:hypothetical protein
LERISHLFFFQTELPYNFCSGATNIPNWGPRLQSLHGAFVAEYSRVNSDMQQKVGYPPAEDPEYVLGYMNVATNQVSNRFDCLGLTLEMPFKDCLSNPDPDRGWNASRSRKLGATVLEAILYVQPYLRVEGEFWTNLPAEDAWIATDDNYQEAAKKATEDEDDGPGFQMLKKRYYSDVRQIPNNLHVGNK